MMETDCNIKRAAIDKTIEIKKEKIVQKYERYLRLVCYSGNNTVMDEFEYNILFKNP